MTTWSAPGADPTADLSAAFDKVNTALAAFTRPRSVVTVYPETLVLCGEVGRHVFATAMLRRVAPWIVREEGATP